MKSAIPNYFCRDKADSRPTLAHRVLKSMVCSRCALLLVLTQLSSTHSTGIPNNAKKPEEATHLQALLTLKRVRSEKPTRRAVADEGKETTINEI